MDTDPPAPENSFYTDDVKVTVDMLKSEWSLGPESAVPAIEYEPEKYMTDARTGMIYVYQISRNSSISTTDYRTLRRTSDIGIRVATRFRDVHFAWCDEVYRILMANRRRGQHFNRGYTYLEVTGDRMSTDPSGWYTTTIDVRYVTYNAPIRTPGFGDKINKKYESDKP